MHQLGTKNRLRIDTVNIFVFLSMSLTICYAAAGAGKTHALVHHYLRYALQQHDNFTHILAITFTNKAAHEMKARILDVLHRLAKQQAPHFANLLMQALGLSQQQLQTRAYSVLKSILHTYDAFAVGTMDHFFQQIVTAFAAELNLPIGYEILLDDKQLIAQAMPQLWHHLPQNPSLMQALVNLSWYKIAQGKRWDCQPEVKSLAKQALSASFLQAPSSIARLSQQHRTLLNSIAQTTRAYQQSLLHLARQLWRRVQDAGLQQEHFPWGEAGLWGFLQKIVHTVTPPTLRARRAATDVNLWLKKEHASTSLSITINELQAHLQAWISRYDQHHLYLTTAQAIGRLRYATIPAAQLAKEMEKYCQVTRTLPIAQIPHLIQKLFSQLPVEAVYARMGIDYPMLMVDEFQDVSTLQWALIKPLLRHALAKNGRGFFVGDIKQAIYGWRGGNPNLLLSQVGEDMRDYPLHEQVLRYNYRSAPSIVAFNNAYFTKAPATLSTSLHNAMMQDPHSLADSAKPFQHIQATYAHVKQQLPPTPPHHKSPEIGHVEIGFILQQAPQSRDDWESIAIEATITRIQTLQQAGYNLNDIVLLVRDHRDARCLSEALFTYRKTSGHNITTTTHHLLKDNPYIALIITALRYIHDPAQGTLLATLIHLYQSYVLNNPHANYWQAAHDLNLAKRYLPDGFLTHIKAWKNMPLYALVNQLILHFHLETKAPTAIQALQETVHDRCAKGHIHTWLHWWEQEGQQTKMPSSNALEALRIITIHQAKGLAFDAVIVPFCAWSFDHPAHNPPILWASTKAAPFHQLPPFPVYYGKYLAKTHYNHHYYQAQADIYLESFNLLYVALTRAKKACYVFGPAGSKIAHIGDLLYHTMETLLKQENLSWNVQQQGTLQCYELGKLAHQAPERPTAPHTLKPSPYTQQHHQALLHHVLPSDIHIGKWWHRLLAHIVTKDDIAPTLQRYLASHRITLQQKRAITQTMDKWWQHSSMNDWFSGRWQVKTEHSILLQDGSSLRPDRVMVRHNTAVVLDFKTGKQQPEDHLQVGTYVAQLQHMGYAKVEGHLFYTQENLLLRVV